MKLIQTYYNTNVTATNIDVKANYYSSDIHWLSVAYSALLLKQHNPNIPLHLYGNASMIKLLIEDFGLPYDYSHILNSIPENRKMFYCWPKIETYKLQDEPFIHVDSDIYMWKAIPDRLLKADLVAQHMENDTTFYMRIFQHMQEMGIEIPDFLQSCIGNGYIASYNAGLLGGNNLSFFKEYLKCIDKFLDNRMDMIRLSDQQFLFNVVFEQWLFYAIAKDKQIEVSTYYDRIIKDFIMPNNGVPFQVIDGRCSEYIHIMDYKRQYSCNRFIVRNMLDEFPEYYEKIIRVCKDKGIKTTVKHSKDSNSTGSEVDAYQYTRTTRALAQLDSNISLHEFFKNENRQYDQKQCKEVRMLYAYEKIADNLLQICSADQQSLAEEQIKQKRLLDKIASGEIDINQCRISKTPYSTIINTEKELFKYILPAKVLEEKVPTNLKTIFVYNSLFKKIDEFIYGRLDADLIEEFNHPIKVKDILSKHADDEYFKYKLYRFIKQGIFDNILQCIIV